MSVFDGIHYKKKFENDESVLEVTENNGEILILIKNEGDHPTLITINLGDKTYHVEGYD
jgi:hypothetical protein